MSRTICIVDDDEAVLHSLQMLLGQRGVSATCYPSANAFLKAAALDGCGCLLFDQQMPELRGVELLEILRARKLNTPAIIMTGASDPQLEERAQRAGALAVLHKPILIEELTGTIQRAFDMAYQRGGTLAQAVR